ncbi:uncharacterized protein [Littorina saxatilis]|uniref:Immunoglobulin domain-containing protein n=1 Tax=Littorina saxatilis TaxID=31220 RepID=A0AAN9GEK7_9CAEN
MMLHTVQRALASLCFVVCLVSSADVSCTSPHTVVKGQPVSLTCLYNANLETESQDLYIYRHSEDTDSVIVAICSWKDSSLTCDFQPGYKAMVKGHNVTLDILCAQPEHAGNYTCTTLPHGDDLHIEDCSLSVEGEMKDTDAKITCFAPVQLSREQTAPVTCIFPDSLNAASVMLERYDNPYNSHQEELIRCNTEAEPCFEHSDGLEIRSEHSSRDGHRVLTGNVAKSGQYVCKADLGSGRSKTCTMNVDDRPEKPDTWDSSLHTLTMLMYAILICFILAVLIFGTILLIKRSKKHKNRHRIILHSGAKLLEEKQVNQIYIAKQSYKQTRANK